MEESNNVINLTVVKLQNLKEDINNLIESRPSAVWEGAPQDGNDAASRLHESLLKEFPLPKNENDEFAEREIEPLKQKLKEVLNISTLIENKNVKGSRVASIIGTYLNIQGLILNIYNSPQKSHMRELYILRGLEKLLEKYESMLKNSDNAGDDNAKIHIEICKDIFKKIRENIKKHRSWHDAESLKKQSPEQKIREAYLGSDLAKLFKNLLEILHKSMLKDEWLDEYEKGRPEDIGSLTEEILAKINPARQAKLLSFPAMSTQNEKLLKEQKARLAEEKPKKLKQKINELVKNIRKKDKNFPTATYEQLLEFIEPIESEIKSGSDESRVFNAFIKTRKIKNARNLLEMLKDGKAKINASDEDKSTIAKKAQEILEVLEEIEPGALKEQKKQEEQS